jgi:hypothetical protein
MVVVPAKAGTITTRLANLPILVVMGPGSRSAIASLGRDDGPRNFPPLRALCALRPSRAPEALFMTVNLIQLQPIIALVAGILILIMPRLLNFIVAIYLIIVGITGLLR